MVPNIFRPAVLQKGYIFTTFVYMARQVSTPRWIDGEQAVKMTPAAPALLVPRATLLLPRRRPLLVTGHLRNQVEKYLGPCVMSD
jgi:hypothetical protein